MSSSSVELARTFWEQCQKPKPGAPSLEQQLLPLLEAPSFDPNLAYRGQTPLMRLMEQGKRQGSHTAVVFDRLLELGADPWAIPREDYSQATSNKGSPEHQDDTKRGITPFQEALLYPDLILARRILGAPGRQRLPWSTILSMRADRSHAAQSVGQAVRHRPELGQLLLDAGMPAQTQDAKGRTLLFYTLDHELIKRLVSEGARPDEPDQTGDTPYLFHRKNGMGAATENIKLWEPYNTFELVPPKALFSILLSNWDVEVNTLLPLRARRSWQANLTESNRPINAMDAAALSLMMASPQSDETAAAKKLRNFAPGPLRHWPDETRILVWLAFLSRPETRAWLFTPRPPQGTKEPQIRQAFETFFTLGRAYSNRTPMLGKHLWTRLPKFAQNAFLESLAQQHQKHPELWKNRPDWNIPGIIEEPNSRPQNQPDWATWQALQPEKRAFLAALYLKHFQGTQYREQQTTFPPEVVALQKKVIHELAQATAKKKPDWWNDFIQDMPQTKHDRKAIHELETIREAHSREHQAFTSRPQHNARRKRIS